MINFNKIATRLLLYFLLVSLAPLTIVWVLNLTVAVRDRQNAVIKNLEADATFYAKNLQEFIENKRQHLKLLANNPFVVASLKSVVMSFEENGLDSVAYREATVPAEAYFAKVVGEAGFYDLFYVSPGEDIVYTFKRENDLGSNLVDGPYRDSGLATVVNRSRSSHKVEFSDYSYYPPSKSYAAFFAKAIFVEDGTYVGTIAMQLNDEELHAVLSDYSKLGESGEIVLARKVDNAVLFLAPLRHDPNAAFTRQEQVGSRFALPMQQATNGVNGSGISVDYRGAEVVAAWRHLQNLNWGMVVKIDSAEAFDAINNTGRLIFKVGLAAGLFLFFLCLLAVRRFTRPLHQLRNATELMAGDDLSVRVPVEGRDEFADLAASFNRMAENLQGETEKRNRELWLRQGLSELDGDLRGQMSAAETAFHGIRQMARKIAAPAAVFYVREGSNLILVASTAEECKHDEYRSFQVGEGLVGQVAADRQGLQIDELPENYFTIRSAVGRSAPRCLYLLPVIYDGVLEGVAEFGLFAALSDQAREYLQQASTVLAMTLNIARSRDELSKSLAESQQLAEELQSSNEELETQAEELAASEEEMQAQAEELRIALEMLQKKNRKKDNSHRGDS